MPTPHQIMVFAQLKTTNFRGILREIKSTTEILGRTGQRDTFRQVRRGQKGDRKGPAPRRAVEAEGDAITRDESGARAACPGTAGGSEGTTWAAQLYEGHGDPSATIHKLHKARATRVG